jgi:hypothetical protein
MILFNPFTCLDTKEYVLLVETLKTIIGKEEEFILAKILCNLEEVAIRKEFEEIQKLIKEF